MPRFPPPCAELPSPLYCCECCDCCCGGDETTWAPPNMRLLSWPDRGKGGSMRLPDGDAAPPPPPPPTMALAPTLPPLGCVVLSGLACAPWPTALCVCMSMGADATIRKGSRTLLCCMLMRGHVPTGCVGGVGWWLGGVGWLPGKAAAHAERRSSAHSRHTSTRTHTVTCTYNMAQTYPMHTDVCACVFVSALLLTCDKCLRCGRRACLCL